MKSKIEWTDHTWNPIRARNVQTGSVGWHCQKVSPGCEHCYAEAMNRRLGTRLSYVPGGEAGLFLDEKVLNQPLRWKKQRRVFVCSMTDLFADFVPDEWIDRIFDVMRKASRHTFQVLTKRSWRMFRKTTSLLRVVPYQNIWLGVSCEDQKRADERVPDLVATPAALRFVSAEPLLGPLNFSDGPIEAIDASTMGDWSWLEYIDWVIVGGESGPGARACRLEWVEGVVRQCQEYSARCFVKQLGAWSEASTALSPLLNGCRVTARSGGTTLALKHPKGGDPEEWPEALRVREWPA